ncbi:MAG TPA: aldo/keto reductase [Nitrososphaerales archaeon]|nr:aldo/keto reductase [Nitrososphaerales archaeon]
MEYRRLGQTREKVSTIGMGTWRIGAFGSPDERARQVAAVRKGIELGINLIDTAEMYASGRSEEVVGDAVKDIRKDVFIATKVSPGNLRHDDVIEACKGSLRRIGTSYIDLYQVHWPNPSIPIRETMSAMEQLVRDGLVRYIGISNFNVSETDAARAALAKSEIVSNQVEYSLTNRYVEPEILPYCVSEKMTLIAYSPLARGIIPDSIPKAILQKYKMTPAQAMLNWVTRDEQVIAIPKATNLGHLEENASSVSVRFERTEYEKIGS